MEDLQVLSSIISQQVEIYTQLLNLEYVKTRILLNKETRELDMLLNQEQPLLMKSSNLEQERIQLQKKMGIELLTLMQIINNFDADNKYELYSRYVELRGLINKTEKANGLNTRLINSRLRMVRNLLGITDEGIFQITYSKEGLVSKG